LSKTDQKPYMFYPKIVNGLFFLAKEVQVLAQLHKQSFIAKLTESNIWQCFSRFLTIFPKSI